MKGLFIHNNNSNKLNPYDFINLTMELLLTEKDDNNLVLIGNPYPSILNIKKFYCR